MKKKNKVKNPNKIKSILGIILIIIGILMFGYAIISESIMEFNRTEYSDLKFFLNHLPENVSIILCFIAGPLIGYFGFITWEENN